MRIFLFLINVHEWHNGGAPALQAGEASSTLVSCSISRKIIFCKLLVLTSLVDNGYLVPK